MSHSANTRRRRAVLIVAAFAMTAGACGGDDDTADDATTTPSVVGDGGTGTSAPVSTAPDVADSTIAASTSPAPPGGGSVVISTPDEPTSLDPQESGDFNSRTVYRNIFDALLQRDSETMEIVPGLATALPTMESELVWEFKLAEGVKFHDGSDFNADTVVATVERLLSLEDSEQAAFFDTLSGATKVDDFTVQINTAVPDPLLPSRMTLMMIVPTDAGDTATFGTNPIGTGPYRFVSWTRGDRVTLERFDGYRGDPPAVQTVEIRAISEVGTQVAALTTNEVDLVPQLSPDQVSQVPAVVEALGTESSFIRIDARTGPLADARVRQAINYAIDRETLAESVYGGYAEPARCQLASPTVFGFNPDLAPYPYDPDKASELIAEAQAEGATLELITPAGRWLKDREASEAVAFYLEEVGLDIEIATPVYSEIVDRLFDKNKFPALQYVSSNTEFFDTERQIGQYLYSTGRASGFNSAELDALGAQATSELDPEARLELYHEITTKACDEAAYLNLMYTKDLYGLSDRISFQPRADGIVLAKDISIL